MMHCVFFGFLLNVAFYFFTKHECKASEFSMPGDYKLGGLFSVHSATGIVVPESPMAIECYKESFVVLPYQMLQVMRFTVEEINNSTTILPNITLGYEIFDYCLNTQSFPSVLYFISDNGRINLSAKDHKYNVIGLVGPYASSQSLTVAPLFMMDLVPMVSYGSSSNVLSNKWVYPSFMRTVPTNQDIITVIIKLIQRFGWNWVAFINDTDAYSRNGLELFRSNIKGTSICLALFSEITHTSDDSNVLSKIDSLSINIVIIFTHQYTASKFIKTAIRMNIRDKVWIAGDAWAMDEQLVSSPGIEQIGTIFGVTTSTLSLPGFEDYVHQTRLSSQNDDCVNCTDGEMCNQVCERCSSLTAEDIINQDPTYSFSIKAAIYTFANALHNLLNCSMAGCDTPRDIPPYVLLNYMRKSTFMLQNQLYKFDQYGDPPANLAVVLWRPKKNPLFVMAASYESSPKIQFIVNTHIIPWSENGTVPYSNCSVECETGYKRIQTSIHQCCFQCEKCKAHTYINTTADAYTCAPCEEGYWSDEKSIICKKRTIVYLQLSDPLCILFLICAVALIALSIGLILLFGINYNTPVVKSAGGNMCFLMLFCLVLANIGVFFYFGVPNPVNCALRNVFFIFFYTICLSCMGVRSFQIVCVFKMAAQFPDVYHWWMKNNGQWLCINVYSFIQLVACGIWLLTGRPKPYNDSTSFKDQTILTCDMGSMVTSTLAWACLWILSVVCFSLSYMGKDLPKSYNEAKSITFSLLVFYLGWIAYFTAYIVFRGAYIQLFNAVAQLSSSYGIIFSFYMPRAYIIIFQPKKNTQAYFQSSIQTYTQTISRM
ncbi:taste receptor type 1 member 1-like [Neoarius graeffei]|uniref:taste receptor type 1 member 1-like n=1 Tax=Neoarius graeffei TaxID=443677 RepID=UPI00298C43CD|nr:taste receptor type 1 member 1-like [Neoarius graeffei]